MRREPNGSKPGEMQERRRIPRVLRYEQLVELASPRVDMAAQFLRSYPQYEGAVIKIKQKEYAIVDMIDRGASGTVYRASNPEGGIVAIKIFTPIDVSILHKGSRQVSDAQLAPVLDISFFASLSRLPEGESFLPKFYGAQFVAENRKKQETSPKDKRIGVMVMECISGGKLSEVCERLYKSESSRSIESRRALFHIAQQLVDAVSFFHRSNVAHLDLKPDNILITEDYSIKVIDFAIANYISLRDEELFAHREQRSETHKLATWKLSQQANGFSPGYLGRDSWNERKQVSPLMREVAKVRSMPENADEQAKVHAVEQHKVARDRRSAALILREIAIGQFEHLNLFTMAPMADLDAVYEELDSPFRELFDISTRLLSDDPEQGITLEQASQEIEALLAAA